MRKLRVAQWRVALDIFHREYRVSWTRQRFAEALIDRAEELEAVGDDATLELLEDRLMAWMDRQKEIFARTADDRAMQEPDRGCFASAWSAEYLRRKIDELRGRLDRFARLFPREEHRRFASTLETIGARLESGAPKDQVAESLRALRLRVIARCASSFKSLSGSESLDRFLAGTGADGAVGPYNRHRTFADAIGEIKATDPIWVGDFVELYSELRRREKALLQGSQR